MGSIARPPPFAMDLPTDPLVQSLVELVGGISELDQAVQTAYKQGPVEIQEWGMNSGHKFLQFATGMLRWIPTDATASKDIYHIICIFNFILEQPPIGHLLTPLSPGSAGAPLSPLSQWLVTFSCKMGEFMNTTESMTPATLESFWNSDNFDMREVEVPPGDFKTFNQFFARRLKPGCRPISGAHDDSVIVSAADSTFDTTLPVNGKGVVTVKNLDWRVEDLLQTSAYAKDFAGGTCVHTFLWLTDYHRVHAPVSGTVLEAGVIQGQARAHVGLMQSLGRRTLEVSINWQGDHGCQKNRSNAGENFAADHEGYQFLQTRGCIIIDNPVVGKVAVLPIGMAQVSSVKLCVQGVNDVGARGIPSTVAKGDELAYFQFGGSDVVVIFQSNPGVDVSTLLHGQHYKVGEQIGTVRRQ